MNDTTIVRLRPGADRERLQRFLEQCSDYYLLHEGWSTPADAGEYELSCVPDGRDSSDVRVFGMADAAGELIGVAQLLRDFPAEGVWWVGLLLVAPPLRSRGLGSQLLQQAIDFVRAEGGRSLRLVVSPRNPRGQAFWRSVGFRDDQQTVGITARSGHVDEGRIMSMDLAAV